jgi:hypothetical protein
VEVVLEGLCLCFGAGAAALRTAAYAMMTAALPMDEEREQYVTEAHGRLHKDKIQDEELEIYEERKRRNEVKANKGEGVRSVSSVAVSSNTI